MSLSEALTALVGEAPAGYEPMIWVFACIFAFYLITSMFGFLASWFRGNR